MSTAKAFFSFYSPPKPQAVLPIRLVDTARDVNEMQRAVRLASHCHCVMCLFHCNSLLRALLALACILLPHSLSVLLDLCPCCVLSNVFLTIPLLTSLFTLIPSCSWLQPCTLFFLRLLLSLFNTPPTRWLGSPLLSAQAAHIPVLPWRPACIRGHGDSMGSHNPWDERGRNTATMKNDEKKEREKERERGGGRNAKKETSQEDRNQATLFTKKQHSGTWAK